MEIPELILYIIVAYIAVMSLLRLMIGYRDRLLKTFNDRLGQEQQRRLEMREKRKSERSGKNAA